MSSTATHGTLIQLYGYGVLLEGESGVGKSLATLTLLKKGGQLISDDIVHLQILKETLIGSAPKNLYDVLEVRGLGLIRPSEYFGSIVLRHSYPIHLILKLKLAKKPDDFQQQRISPLLDWCYYLNQRRPCMTVIITESQAVASFIHDAVCYWHLLTQREDTCTSSLSVADQVLEKPFLYTP
jgi:HPr kinase/phosphorylase